VTNDSKKKLTSQARACTRRDRPRSKGRVRCRRGTCWPSRPLQRLSGGHFKIKQKKLTVLERAFIAEGGLLGVTPSTGDRVGSWHAGNARDRVRDELVVLDVEALDLGDRATDEL